MILTIETFPPFHAGQHILITNERGVDRTGTVLWQNAAQVNVAVGGQVYAFQHEDRVWSWTDATPGPPC